MPKLLHKEGECQRSGECVSGSVSGSGVGVGVGVGVRVWVWEWEWACGRRGSSTGRGFARRPQGLLGWEGSWELGEVRAGVGVGMGVECVARARVQRIKVSQGARRDSWRGCM